MDKFNDLAIENQLKALREGIKSKYKEYHALNRDRFPDFEYNTNRANYEPLRESFEEEFYVIRNIERTNKNIHIPSTNTLALIFYDDNYVPGKKIFNTCRSYAEGKSTQPEVTVVSQSSITNRSTIAIFITGLVILSGLLFYIYQKVFTTLPTGLIIEQPTNNILVPMEVTVEGKVSNARKVWIVVRYAGGLRYWVQPPIEVEDDGKWKGAILIGEDNIGDMGLRSQIRAFVNPVKSLKGDEVLYSWPEAQLSSKVVEVIRGSQTRGSSSGLSIELPSNGMIVPRESFAEGRVSNAGAVWLIIHPPNTHEYWVQSPAKVEQDGTWKGLILVGGKGQLFNGARAEIRAFVNPFKQLKEGEMIYSWPKAQLSTKRIEVIRGIEKE